ncbi:hypothetical protein FACS18949_12800 [Clostridia bacterium]|nr:hypothetical protein FACS18949_12800 [Clostridia bacterium]
MDFGRCRFIGVWTDWENEIHADEAQIGRQGRSMTYPFDFKVNEKTKSARFSSTTDLPFYKTTLNSCNCYDFQERKLPCKHIYRLAVELGLIEIIKRPTFDKETLESIKESADIDAHPEQVKRQKSAMGSKCAPTDINFVDKTAIFTGSGKIPYTTTTESCTCRDFFVRKLPCKHIYRLRHELSNTE